MLEKKEAEVAVEDNTVSLDFGYSKSRPAPETGIKLSPQALCAEGMANVQFGSAIIATGRLWHKYCVKNKRYAYFHTKTL
ncbi:MAG: hypothetical protein ACLURV_10155 [Gallintestinimicrobium sp.]